MKKIYSYILRFDDGAAPNPFHGTCTLAICKPKIRRTAQIGDWVVGTGSKNSKCNDGKFHNLSQCLVYAMQITDKMTFIEYDKFCQNQLINKIPVPTSTDWTMRMGDCIYFDNGESVEAQRPQSIHDLRHSERDLGGKYVLLSSQFYYFGENALPIPSHLSRIIKRNQGHLKIEIPELLAEFEEWIKKYEINKLYGDPQLMYRFKRTHLPVKSYCTKVYNSTDNNENEQSLRSC